MKFLCALVALFSCCAVHAQGEGIWFLHLRMTNGQLVLVEQKKTPGVLKRGRGCGLALILLLTCSFVTHAQTIQTLVTNGPTSKRLNITFFSEGYTTDQLPQFINDVQSVLVPFFLTPPYNVYSNCFNVHALSV